MANRTKERLRFNDFVEEYNKEEKKISKMKDLRKCFEDAKRHHSKFVGVKIMTPSNTEIIIVRNNDFKNKLEYYKKAYNEDLILNTNKDICIKAFDHADTLNDLGYSLFKRK